LIKADGNIDVIVRGEADVTVGFGKANAGPKTRTDISDNHTAGTKRTPKAGIKKGTKTMTTINSIQKGVGKASSLPGE